METIKDTIKNLMQTWEAQKKVSSKSNPAILLKKVLTRKELAHIRLNYFKRGILNINVDSSVWLYHLSLQKDGLLNKLRAKSTAVIKDIRFRLGETR